MNDHVGGRRATTEAGATTAGRRLKTQPLPKLPQGAFEGPRTLETRAIPGLLLMAFVVLLVIQFLLAV